LGQDDERAHPTPIVTDCAAKVSHVQGPELSVVICTLGREEVAETVHSVQAAGAAADRQVEVLVVWQGDEPAPPLGTATVLTSFPGGLSYARNRGLEASHAPYVAFVDDDEVVDAGWVAGLFAAFDLPGVAAVFGPIAPRDDRGLPYCRYDGAGELRVVGGPRTLPWTIGTGGNMAFRREDLVASGGFDVLFGLGAVARSAEDTEAIHRLVQAGRRVAWSPDVVVYHPTKTREERLASRFPYAYGIGKLARRHRDPVLAARYAKSILDATAGAVRSRDSRRLRETRETLRGFVAGVGLRARPVSPERLLVSVPDEVAEALDGARPQALEPLYRPDPHYMYAVTGERLLHVYADPSDRLREGLAARERIRAESQLQGIPRLLASGESRSALWVLEDRLPGSPPPRRDPTKWFPEAARWALDLGGAPGPPVREGSWWADEAAAAVEVATPELRDAVSAALDGVGALPSRRLHGDFQRKNILVDRGGGIGVVDWERAYEDGPPGLDVLFLALMARGDRPDQGLVRTLAAGRDPEWAPLQRLLRGAGVEGIELRTYLLAALAVWAADERLRAGALGLPRAHSEQYRELLLDVGPELA
jgi:Glycosyl transferase family 2/Phosphotransferase enzyme family